MTLSVPLPKKTRLFVVHMFWRDETVRPTNLFFRPTGTWSYSRQRCRKIGLHMNKVIPSNRNEVLELLCLRLFNNETHIEAFTEDGLKLSLEVISDEGIVPLLVYQPRLFCHCAIFSAVTQNLVR